MNEKEEESQSLLLYEEKETRYKILEREISEVKGYTICTCLCCLVAAFGCLSIGINLGISSPLIPGIQQDKSHNTPCLNAKEASWFGGSLSLGGLFGGLIGGYLVDHIGRKYTIIISSIPLTVGLVVIATATQTWMLYVGRGTTGVGSGIAACVIPIYIGEISPSATRGVLSSAFEVSVMAGIFLIYGLGVVFPWRVISAVATVPSILLMLLSGFIVESPRYFILKHKKDKAAYALQRLRGPDANIEKEYDELESCNSDIKQATWLEIIKERSLRIPTLLVLALMYFQIFSGIDCILFYEKTIFLEAGYTGKAQINTPLLSSTATMFLFTLISCFIVDKVGRKVLLVASGVGSALSLTTLGIYFLLIQSQTSTADSTSSATAMTTTSLNVTQLLSPQKTEHLTWMALASVIVYMATFSMGLSPIPWMYLSEMLPLRARGKAAGLGSSTVFLASFAATSWFSSMMKTFTPQGTFWFFAANCAVCVPFTIFCLPETKGKTLEEIESYFQNKKQESSSFPLLNKISQQ